MTDHKAVIDNLQTRRNFTHFGENYILHKKLTKNYDSHQMTDVEKLAKLTKNSQGVWTDFLKGWESLRAEFNSLEIYLATGQHSQIWSGGYLI